MASNYPICMIPLQQRDRSIYVGQKRALLESVMLGNLHVAFGGRWLVSCGAWS